MTQEMPWKALTDIDISKFTATQDGYGYSRNSKEHEATRANGNVKKI